MIDESNPFERYEWHTVTFPAADQDLIVPHGLNAEDPNTVYYVVMANDGDGVIYDSRRRAGGLAWTRDTIYLRCSRGPTTATLLLVVMRVADPSATSD